MKELYFKNSVTTVTTLLILGLFAYIVLFFLKRNYITRWGLPILGLFIIGLVLCCYAAARDKYHVSVENMIGTTNEIGLFSATGTTSIIACIFGGVLFLILLVALFSKNQDFKRTLFFTFSGIVTVKLLFVEISRIFAF